MTANQVSRKAARLAALLPLWRSGQLAHMTYQHIADLIGAGYRSTAFRTIQDLPDVEQLYQLYTQRLPGCRRQIRKCRNRNI